MGWKLRMNGIPLAPIPLVTIGSDQPSRFCPATTRVQLLQKIPADFSHPEALAQPER